MKILKIQVGQGIFRQVQYRNTQNQQKWYILNGRCFKVFFNEQTGHILNIWHFGELLYFEVSSLFYPINRVIQGQSFELENRYKKPQNLTPKGLTLFYPIYRVIQGQPFWARKSPEKTPKFDLKRVDPILPYIQGNLGSTL